MKWKQWKHGRQKDSYLLQISVKDAEDLLMRIQEGKKIPRKFRFNLYSIIKDFVEVNNKFKKDQEDSAARQRQWDKEKND